MTHNPDIQRFLPASVAQVPMQAHRIVCVSGADAETFLQGQFSNDVRALGETPAQLSSWNSPKGRVLALLRVLRVGDDYWLVVDAAIAEAFVQRLRMYVLRSKVSIGLREDLAGHVIAGADLAKPLGAANVPVQTAAFDDGVSFALPGPVPRVEIYAPHAALPALDVPYATAEDLARWDVLFRLPRLLPVTQDAHVAQHLGLDELGAISFKKGCYTGQEIIARMKYLGRVKKGTAVFVASGANPGDVIRAGEQAAGDAVNVAPLDDGTQLLLAVVSHDDLEQPLHINGAAITRVPA